MTLSLRSRFVRGLLFSLFAGMIGAGLNADDTRAQGAPDSLAFQGFLTDPGGVPLDTTVQMSFTLYKNNTSAWTETQPAVTVTNGAFSVLLGGLTPLDTVAFDQPIDLGITVGEDPELAPRTPLPASPFALAMRALHASWAVFGSSSGFNIVGGVPSNTVSPNTVGATIGGGGGTRFDVPRSNTVTGNFGTIGGGNGNTAAIEATVGGGELNSAAGQQSTIGGGSSNATSGAGLSTIAGGGFNVASGQLSSVGGGATNKATDSYATVGGGDGNTASGSRATVGGGYHNVASGSSATVPGGEENRAHGISSFAAGHDAKAIHDGTFVWNDRSITTDNDSLLSTGPNQFLIRAAGGVGINMNAPAHPIHVGTDATNGNGAHLTAEGNWVNPSSRSLKDGFEEVDQTDLLERLASIPVMKWHYRGKEQVSHIGPTAEDFQQAFGLGHDSRYITTVDADGVALAAIQGLYELVKDLQTENERMREVMRTGGLE